LGFTIHGEVSRILGSKNTFYNISNIRFRLPFDYHFFPTYQIVYFIISYSLFVVIMTIGGVDGCVYGSCLYIAGQFQIVEQKINDLKDLTLDDSKPLPLDKNRNIKQKLIEIIKHHNQCFDLTVKASRVYEFVVLTQFVSTSVVIAMCSLNIMLSKGPDKLTFASYLLAASIQMFAFCKNGSTLTDSSANVATAIYNFEWYKCDKEVKYLVLTILMRSQKTTELKIPFCSASMATFVRVSDMSRRSIDCFFINNFQYLQSTASFITLLRSFF
jgi:7tm Odorant receptor